MMMNDDMINDQNDNKYIIKDTNMIMMIKIGSYNQGHNSNFM